jgi:branched-chain amino acid aminotransferase
MTGGGANLPLLWVDGAFHPPEARVYAASDRGATLADAVFDTALCLGGQPVEAEAHRRRLDDAIGIFGHSCPPDLVDAAYGLAALAEGPAVLRVSVSRGPGARGLGHNPLQKSQVVAQLSHLPDGIQFAPVRLDIADIPRNEGSPTSRYKTAAYLDAILAMRRAQERGLDDALFLNCAGRVACTTMANVFAISGKALITPPCADGALNGITRRRLMELAPALGLTPQERPLTLDEVMQADEVFACNSLRLVMPVCNLGGTGRAACSALALALRDHVLGAYGAALPVPAWIESS